MTKKNKHINISKVYEPVNHVPGEKGHSISYKIILFIMKYKNTGVFQWIKRNTALSAAILIVWGAVIIGLLFWYIIRVLSF